MRMSVRLLAITAMLFVPAMSSPSLAVDNSISALCRAGAPESYSRPGGFCEAVANNKTMLPPGTPFSCPVGYEPNPTPPPKCIPEV